MSNKHWPLFDLRIRTPRLELRPPDDEELVRLADLAVRGVHDPATMPFMIPWTDTPKDEMPRAALQWWWRQRADLQPTSWSLTLAVHEGDEIVGIQDVNGKDFALARTVETGSWLGLAHQGRGIGKEMRAAVLHLAFAGLSAQWALTGAWHDNQASLGVTRSLGYEPNGESVALRRGQPDVQLHFRLGREAWEQRRRDDITVEGLEPCRALLGIE